MKNPKLLLFLLLLPLMVFSQKLEYGKLDTISQDISRYQFSANDYTCEGGNFTVSFPEESFTVFSYDRKAQNIIYRKSGDREVAEFTENIDLSKIKAITVEECSKELKMIRLHFPAGVLTTTDYVDGAVAGTRKPDWLDLYVKNSYNAESESFLWDDLFLDINKLAMAMRWENGQGTLEDAVKERQAFLELSSEDFLSKYPNSILSEQAKKNKAEHDELMRTAQAWLDNFCLQYHFVPGATLDDLAAAGKPFTKAINDGHQDFEEHGQILQHYENLLVRKQFYDGLYFSFTLDSTLYSIMYQTVWEQSGTYSWAISELKNNLPSELLTEDKQNSFLKVISPDKKYKVLVYDNTMILSLTTPE
jgi:hypothetical protein